MVRKLSFWIGCLLIITGILSIAMDKGSESPKEKMGEKMQLSGRAIEFKMEMRKLWEDQIAWTRNYIISALAGLEDTDTVAKRLLKNQDNIGEALNPYCQERSKEFAMLFREYIISATEAVAAAKVGKAEDMEKARGKWRKSADDIAVLLSESSSRWSKKQCADMLYKNIELTMGQCTSRIKKDWAADIDYYDQGHSHMLIFADFFSEGLIWKFSDKFK